MSKLIYIAGPYRSSSEYGVLRNIQRAQEAAAEVWKLGLYALCPHANSAFFGGITSDEQFLDGGLEMLRRCDAVYLVPIDAVRYNRSKGTLAEVAEAERLDIPIFNSLGDLATWRDLGD